LTMIADNKAKKLVLILANGANDDKSTVAFTIANAALSTGMEVGMFLTSDGVEIGRDKSCDFTSIKPFKALGELVDGFVDNGGVMWTCAPCYQHRGLDPADAVDGSQVTGAGPMLEWVAAGASTICL
jgi:predicted peroxiredoxin